MDPTRQTSLQGLRVISFESRRAREIAELIRRYEGKPVIAPSMREVPLGENSAALNFFRELESGKIDFIVFLTGVGTRTLVDALATQYARDRIVAALGRAGLVARGPKPVAALKELGLEPSVSVPEPNTWKEVLSQLDARAALKGRRVAVQEYGVTNPELVAGLEARGAEVVRVPVYRWALPEDTGPLRSAIGKILDGEADLVLFTNATQVDHLFKMAAGEKLDQRLRAALGRMVIASIGPICSGALKGFGLHVDLEPDHPKMGHLIAALARKGRELLEAKRVRSGR